jgi:FkbM family methyltransferase
MIQEIKNFVRNTFRTFGVDIRRIPEYEKNKFVWLKDLNINTILDVGANIGQFVLEINRYLPSAQIYSFEPLKDAYLQLVRNGEKIKNLRVFNIALGDFNGTTKIYGNKFSPASSILELTGLAKEAYPFVAYTFEEEVSVRKFDGIVIDENIELKSEVLIKLDMQGYEDRVIEGGINTFRKAKVVITEVSFQELYKDQVLFDLIYDELKELGFKYKGNINISLHSKIGTPLFADAIFVRE